MADSVHVICPECSTANRVPTARLAERPTCGRCKARLFQGQPVEADARLFARHAAPGAVPVLADFWAAWCGPCRAMAPAFKAAAADLEPAVRLLKVNTEAAPDLAARFAIQSIPTLMLLTGGREAARISGAMDRASLVRWVQEALSGARR